MKISVNSAGSSIAETIFAAITILLAGCAVGPKYVAPTNHLAPFHNSIPPDANGATKPQLDTWWTGFDDPMLVTIVERALNQNLDLASALARIQQARAVAKGA